VFPRPDLSRLTEAEKDALILALFDRLEAMEREIAALKAQLGEPPKTPDNSSLPPSKGQKANRRNKQRRKGPRQGSLGRKGGGRPLSCTPDETVIAKPTCCMHCQTAFADGDHVLHGRYDKVDLPPVRPVVTRVERYSGHCRCCGGITLAPVPEGLEQGSPFSLNIMALAIYLRFTHAISYKRLTRLFLHLFALEISEGALDAMFRRAMPCFDSEVAAILARLRRARVVCSDETTVRIDGVTHWNWVFQNEQVVIHVIRNSRGAGVVSEVLAGHRPKLWVSDLFGAQQGHAELWQVCLAHQLRDCQFAIDAGDTVFAPRMKALLLRTAVLGRRSKTLAQSTRNYHLRRLNDELNRVMALAPDNPHGKRLRKRYHKVRVHLFTFLAYPEVPPDNNGSERELRPTATYRKVTGGFRSDWGATFFAGVRSVVGTAARSGIDAYQAIRNVLGGGSALQPG
jgi:transposase